MPRLRHTLTLDNPCELVHVLESCYQSSLIPAAPSRMLAHQQSPKISTKRVSMSRLFSMLSLVPFIQLLQELCSYGSEDGFSLSMLTSASSARLERRCIAAAAVESVHYSSEGFWGPCLVRWYTLYSTGAIGYRPPSLAPSTSYRKSAKRASATG